MGDIDFVLSDDGLITVDLAFESINLMHVPNRCVLWFNLKRKYLLHQLCLPNQLLLIALHHDFRRAFVVNLIDFLTELQVCVCYITELIIWFSEQSYLLCQLMVS